MTQPTEPRERPMHQAHVRGCVDQTHSFLSPCSVATQPTGGTSGASLRDALATALHVVWDGDVCVKQADAILADPAFRAALTEAISDAAHDARYGSIGWYDDHDGGDKGCLWLARAIVARMLP
jgi:hypothetical protein